MNIRENKGITLTTLVVTIVVLLILAGVATSTGIEAIENTKYTKFVAELKIMQSHVNQWYEDCKPNSNETFEGNIANKFTAINAKNATEDEQAQTTLTNANILSSEYGNYYLLQETQKSALGIEGVSQKVLVSVKNRKVVSYDGLKYKNRMYYTIDDQSGDGIDAVYNVEYDSSKIKNDDLKPLIDVSKRYRNNGESCIFTVNITYPSDYIKKGKIYYGLQNNNGNVTNWDTTQDTTFTVKQKGTYQIYVEDAGGNRSEVSTQKFNGIIPEGFVASQATGENRISEGLVIYEGTTPVTDENVEEARRTRNQFVWVPVATEGLTYAKDTTYSNTYGIYQYYYKDYNDWEDNTKTANNTNVSMTKNKESVSKYGGFYIGRYEAGFPGVVKTVNGTQQIEPLGENDDIITKNYFTTTVNGTTINLLPEIKKGYAPWDRVNQINAKLLSENLYKDNLTITNTRSQLMDSYAFDTTVNWFKKVKIITESDNNHYIDCKDYGNYLNSTFSFSNALYIAYPYYKGKNGTSDLCDQNNSSYKIGSNDVKYTVDIEEEKINNYSSKMIKVVLSLGATDSTKAKNIYDLAGNLWEWTTEEGTWGGTSFTHAVIRGGRFSANGNQIPIVYRNGGWDIRNYDYSIGFRVVLYLED